MKKIIIAALLIAGCCKRYESGPGISFRSKSERVCNRWKVDLFFVDHADRTIWFHDTHPGYAEIFTKEHEFTRVSANGLEKGSWDFFDYKDEVRVVTASGTVELVLLKLEEKALWYSCMNGSVREEYHLEPE
jgi:hypothetical protein